MKTDQVNEILNKDINKNINIINFIESYEINKIDIHKYSVLVRGKSDHNWVYLSSESANELIYLLNDNDDTYFAAIEDWMIPYIIKDIQIDI